MASASGPGPVRGQSGNRPAASQTEIQRLLKAGIKLFHDNEDLQALAIFKKAYLLSSHLREPLTQARCLFNLGAAYIATGKPQKGLKCTWKAKKMGAAEKDGDFSFNIAAAYDNMRQYAKAAEFYGKAVSEYESSKAPSAADALVKLAYCLASTGESASAAQSFCLAGRAYQEAQQLDNAAVAMREAANYFLRSPRCRPEDVLEALQECSRICARMTNPELLGKLHNHLGLHYAELKCFGQAEKHFVEAVKLCSGGNFTLRKKAVLLQNLGAIYNALEEPQRALKYHGEAADTYGRRTAVCFSVDICPARLWRSRKSTPQSKLHTTSASQGPVPLIGVLGERAAQAQCLYNLASAHSQQGDYHTAQFYHQQAMKAFVEGGDLYGEAQGCEGLGATHLCLGHPAQAVHYYKQALALFEKSKEASEVPRKRILEKLAECCIPHIAGFVNSRADEVEFPHVTSRKTPSEDTLNTTSSKAAHAPFSSWKSEEQKIMIC
ncbi:tetratricopeptide repeat protein 24-like isoform X2 [Eublepharis macularius]|uniref:Tetratricopeptide repeat protein 24-like isoform X2 n=1 Tax=Eublepharis macularius TaxID=481883 RepID=A0AA97LLU9_EUBMA|nr:tetratricopeptide repeat protein 24-like isoform X2 [Eublepharis macularius]